MNVIGRRLASSLFCALLTSFSLVAPARAAEPYELNVILSMTGNAGFVGHGNASALSALEAYINATGGINGQPLKFVINDDQSNPQVGVQIANALLAQNPAVVLGSDLSSVCNAVASVFKDGPLLYCLSPGVRPAPGSWLFANFTPTTDAISAVLRFCREHGWDRVSFITSTDATGLDADKAIDDNLTSPENKVLTRAGQEHFNVADLSVAAQIARIKSANPQALVVWTTGAPFGTILTSISQVGLQVPVIALGSNASLVAMKQFALVLPKDLYFSATLPLAGGSGGDAATRGAIGVMNKALLAAGTPNDFVNEIPWDPAALVVAALRKLGTRVTGAQLKDYISTLHWNGINGRYDFVAHPQRGLGTDTWVIVRWDPRLNYWTGASKPGGGIR